MTKPTIDGVSRELLFRVSKPIKTNDEYFDRVKARDEIRALLAAPAVDAGEVERLRKMVREQCGLKLKAYEECDTKAAVIAELRDKLAEMEARLTEAYEFIDNPNDEDMTTSAEPPKQKPCPECAQPHCHGVCVERGDEHYDRDHAEKVDDHE
jgi:hypothetical protein